MKVVHLLPALEQGGVESVVCDLVRALPCNSVVVSKGGRLVARVEAAGGRHIAMDLKSKNPLTYFTRAWKLRKLLRAEQPDLVCVHSRVPAWLYLGARKINSTIRRFDNSTIFPPWISYAHGANSVSHYSEVMTKGDLVIVPSKFLADYLKANYKIGDEKIRIVPNPVDTERFDPAKLDKTFIAEKRREWGIQKGDYVQMVVGRITPVKGIEGLIENLKSQISNLKSGAVGSKSNNRTIEQSNNVKLVIVGGADKHHQKYLSSLKALASSLNFSTSQSPSVIFAGPQEKIPECIAIADEIVSGNVTKPETFGLSIVEAYAMNKPVRVARRFGGVAEVMDAVENAGLVTLRDAVLKLYGLDKFAERTLTAYREICRA